MRITGPFRYIYKAENFVISMFIGLLVISSSIIVIYSKHRIRQLHIELENIHKERASLAAEWNTLLLEKTTWMSDGRVEKIAKTVLAMQPPDYINIIR